MLGCVGVLISGAPNRWSVLDLLSVTSEFESLGDKAQSVTKLDVQRAFFNLWLLSHDTKANAPRKELTASAGAVVNSTKAPFGFLCDSYSLCKVPQHVWQFVADTLTDENHARTDEHAREDGHYGSMGAVHVGAASLESRVRQILEETGGSGILFSASQYSWVRDVLPGNGPADDSTSTSHRKLLVDEVRSHECETNPSAPSSC